MIIFINLMIIFSINGLIVWFVKILKIVKRRHNYPEPQATSS